MNCQIFRRDGQKGSALVLDGDSHLQIGQLGQKAETIINEQDLARWAEAGDPDFLKYAMGGAIVLKQIGITTEKDVFLEDAGAHMAFMCCCALSLFIPRLSAEELKALKNTLKIMALCCPVKIHVKTLPPLANLPEKFRMNPLMCQQYRRFQQVVSKPGGCDLSLAEALALLRIFKAGEGLHYAEAIRELEEATEGLRTALHRLREVRP
jgi:hypothetical protein